MIFFFSFIVFGCLFSDSLLLWLWFSNIFYVENYKIIHFPLVWLLIMKPCITGSLESLHRVSQLALCGLPPSACMQQCCLSQRWSLQQCPWETYPGSVSSRLWACAGEREPPSNTPTKPTWSTSLIFPTSQIPKKSTVTLVPPKHQWINKIGFNYCS